MDHAPRLRVISRTGVGYDTVDVAAATARGVAVCFAPGRADRVDGRAHGRSPAGRDQGHQRLGEPLVDRAGCAAWASSSTVGRSACSASVASPVASPWWRVRSACSRSPTTPSSTSPTPDVTLVDADELWRRSDVVTLHAPATPSTHHVVDATALAAMPAWIVPRQLRPRQLWSTTTPCSRRARPRSPRRRRARRHRARAAPGRPPAASPSEGRHHPAHRLAHRGRTSAALPPRHRQRPRRARRRARIARARAVRTRPARSTS